MNTKIIKVGDEMLLTNMNGILNGIRVKVEVDCTDGLYEVKLLEAPTGSPWRIGDIIAAEYSEMKTP